MRVRTVRGAVSAAVIIAVALIGLSQPGLIPQPITVCPEGPPQCQFDRLSEAIAAAEPFGLIWIYPGDYEETLVLDKSLRLIATEQGKVRLQGIQTGLPTLLVEVTGEMRVVLEGFSLLSPADPDPAGTCQDSHSVLCSRGVVIRGEGMLHLTLVNMELTQRASQGSAGLACTDFTGEATVLVERSRVVAHRDGIAWSCPNTTLTIRNTLISGNRFRGVTIFTPALVQSPTEVSIESSLFMGNPGLALAGSGENFELRVVRSEFFGNAAGVLARAFDPDSRIEILDSVIAQHSDFGVFFGGMSGFDQNRGQYVLAKSQIVGNLTEAVRVATSGQVELERNSIKENGHGVRVVYAGGRLRLQENEIAQNAGWGVALDLPECFESPIPTLGEVERAFHIEGENNVLMNNGIGPLCPESFPWPEDFIAP